MNNKKFYVVAYWAQGPNDNSKYSLNINLIRAENDNEATGLAYKGLHEKYPSPIWSNQAMTKPLTLVYIIRAWYGKNGR